MSTIRSMIKIGVRAIKAQKLSKKITAVALHGSGYRGFVEIGCETETFDPMKPDCGADVTMAQLARREFPHWRKAYEENNQVIVHYGEKKPSIKTSRATCEKKDEPFFRFLKSVLKNAIKEGDFAKLPLAEDCLFGVQTYFHHHCEFWDKDGKKAKGPTS